MFPIRDHNPSQNTPIVTYALIALNVVMYLLTLPGFEGGAGLWDRLALYPAAIMHGEWLWGLGSHMFLHAGFMHILGNMLFLWIYGDNIEDQMGRWRFLAFYLTCGLIAAGSQIVMDPHSTIPMVGASGAVAGVMGGYLLLFPRARIDILFIFIIFFKVFTIPAWIMLGLWIGLQFFGGFTYASDGGGVAYWAHIGGFVAGVALTLPLFFMRGGPQLWQRNHGRPPHPEAEYSASRIPRVRR